MVLLLENVIKNEKISFIGTNAPLASFPGLFSLGMRLVCVYEAITFSLVPRPSTPNAVEGLVKLYVE